MIRTDTSRIHQVDDFGNCKNKKWCYWNYKPAVEQSILLGILQVTHETMLSECETVSLRNNFTNTVTKIKINSLSVCEYGYNFTHGFKYSQKYRTVYFNLSIYKIWQLKLWWKNMNNSTSHLNWRSLSHKTILLIVVWLFKCHASQRIKKTNMWPVLNLASWA